MRVLVCAFLLPLLLFAQTPQSPATFPIPKGMQGIWPGAKLTDADKLLLRKAVETDLQEFDRDLPEDQRPRFESADTADLDLGSLGNGVLVTLSESVLCGTGGCPIYAYAREKDSYRKVLGGRIGRAAALGWAFAVVKSETTIRDLVIASNFERRRNRPYVIPLFREDVHFRRLRNPYRERRRTERAESVRSGSGRRQPLWHANDLKTLFVLSGDLNEGRNSTA